MTRSTLSHSRRAHRRGHAAGARVLLILCLAALGLVGGALALALNPVTGPEIRDYLRDRFLRPDARLPERTW